MKVSHEDIQKMRRAGIAVSGDNGMVPQRQKDGVDYLREISSKMEQLVNKPNGTTTVAAPDVHVQSPNVTVPAPQVTVNHSPVKRWKHEIIRKNGDVSHVISTAIE